MEFFKETEFHDSLIGTVPSDWDTRELGDERIASIIAGQSPPSSTYRKENQGLPFLQGKTEFGDMFPSPTVYCSKPIKVARKDDVLLSVRAPVGDVNVAPFECCIGRGIAAIRTKKDRLSHMFLFYYLSHEGRRFRALSTGSTFKAIRMREIEGFQVPLPPTVEQTAIVEVLGVVDSAIELADQVIAKTERLKKGLMQQLLTCGIGHAEYKNIPIGKIPKDWEAVKLKEVVLSYKNGIYKPSQYAGKGYPCVRMYNIVAGRINLENAALLDVTEQELEEFGLKPGDIVVNRVNTSELVGKAGVVPAGFGRATFESKNIRVRIDTKKVSPEFLSAYVQTKAYSNQLLSRAKTAVAQATVTQEDLDSVVIPLPPTIDEQQKIAEVINTTDRKLASETEEKAKLEKIKGGLMDLLLTGRVRIKVD